jgi:hypothetical protein
VEGIHLAAVLGRKSRVLLDAIRMEAVDPEHRVIDPIADAIGTVVLGKLGDPAEAERA